MSMTNAYIPGLRAAVGHGLPGRPQRTQGVRKLPVSDAITFIPATNFDPNKVYAGGIYLRADFPQLEGKFPAYKPVQLLTVPAILEGTQPASIQRGGGFSNLLFNPSRTRVAGTTQGLNSSQTYPVKSFFLWTVGTNTFAEYSLEDTSSYTYAFRILGWAGDFLLVERRQYNASFSEISRVLNAYNTSAGTLSAVGATINGTLGQSFELVHIDSTHAYLISGTVYVKVSRSTGSASTTAGVSPAWGWNSTIVKMWGVDGKPPLTGNETRMVSSSGASAGAWLHVASAVGGVLSLTSTMVISGTPSNLVPLSGAVASRGPNGTAYCIYPDGSFELKPEWLGFSDDFWAGAHPYPPLKICYRAGKLFYYDLTGVTLSAPLSFPLSTDVLYPFAPGFAPENISEDIGHKGIKTSPSTVTGSKSLAVFNADTQFAAVVEPGMMEVL